MKKKLIAFHLLSEREELLCVHLEKTVPKAGKGITILEILTLNYFQIADILHMEKYVKLQLVRSHVNCKILQAPNLKMKGVKLQILIVSINTLSLSGIFLFAFVLMSFSVTSFLSTIRVLSVLQNALILFTCANNMSTLPQASNLQPSNFKISMKVYPSLF